MYLVSCATVICPSDAMYPLSPPPKELSVVTEQAILDYFASEYRAAYKESSYIAKHPEDVTPEEIVKMTDDEFEAFATGVGILDQFRATFGVLPKN